MHGAYEHSPSFLAAFAIATGFPTMGAKSRHDPPAKCHPDRDRASNIWAQNDNTRSVHCWTRRLHRNKMASTDLFVSFNFSPASLYTWIGCLTPPNASFPPPTPTIPPIPIDHPNSPRPTSRPSAGSHLRGDVVRGPAEGACGHVFIHVLLAHPEVGNLDVAFRIEHDIVQLQVPVARGHSEGAVGLAKHTSGDEVKMEQTLRPPLLLPLLCSLSPLSAIS